MAKCYLCGAETVLHINGVPICVKCDEQTPEKNSVQAEPDKKPEAQKTGTS